MPSVPVLTTLRGYQRSWLVADVVAGLTLAAIAIPEQMATAKLAGVPAVTGLYAFLAGTVTFAVLGSSRSMSIGADSTIAPVFAAGVATVTVAGTTRYLHLVTFLALLVGALVAAVGLLRLGWIADFLPAPVVTGVLAGIAIQIGVRQLPAVLGVAGDGTTTVGRLRAVFGHRGQATGWSVGIAATVFALIVVAERVNRRVPGALIGLVVSTAVVALFDLRAHGVGIVGSVHAGLPSLGSPSVHLGDVRDLLGPALTVAFVCVVQTAATARSAPVDSVSADQFDRDLVALGAGNLVAGLSGSFAVNASPPRTAVVTASGGRSQLSGLVAAAGVVVVLVAAGLLQDLPEATLGAILIFVATKLFGVAELRRVLRFDRVEFALAVITVVVVGFIGIEQGVVVAGVLALAQRTRLAARPRDAVLGRVPGTDHWIPADVGQPTEQVPGVLVYLLYAPLWYGNAAHVAARMRQVLESAPEPVHALVFDANGVSDIDYTAARALSQLAVDLQRQGVHIGVARTSHLVHRNFKHSGLLDDIGADRLFPSVQDAVIGLCG
ncbi:MAG: SulP family inorganic anion transporter [Actinomycetota bacterium]|nr:SulP family inorganic anion transporter [Actinomycetota bacterium]